MDLPAFPSAVAKFREFLAAQGETGDLVWIFREDVYRTADGLATIRVQGSAGNNVELSEKVYEEGRARGLVEITAVARACDRIAATVWFPRLPEQEIQGWNRGLKLCRRQPLSEARIVSSGPLWRLHTMRPAWKRFQSLNRFLETRSWASASLEAGDHEPTTKSLRPANSQQHDKGRS